MAKSAKQVDLLTDRKAVKHVKDVLECYENIESARGKFMNAARKERERMSALYEGFAAQGVPQKAAKTNIKIIRALEKIKGWLADLEADDKKMAQRLAKLQGDKRQLMLFAELPQPTKAELKAEKQAKAEAAQQAKTDLETQPAAGMA